MSIIIFALSFLGVLAMIVARLYELRVRRAIFTSKLIARTDKFVEQLWRSLKLAGAKLAQFCQQKLSVQINRLTSYLDELIGKKYFAFTESLGGRQVLQNRGSASFFLQRISADKRRVTMLEVVESDSE